MYKTEYRCELCNGRLSFYEVMYSSGICPLCGLKAEHACTVVSTTEHGYMNVKIGKWWQLWKGYKRVYAQPRDNKINEVGNQSQLKESNDRTKDTISTNSKDP